VTAPLVAAAALGAGAFAGIDRAFGQTDETTTAAGGAVTAEPAAAVTAQLDPTELYAQAAPGVVEIDVSATGENPFGPSQSEGVGTGFVLDEEGNIVTNAHVVDGATSITVRFQDGTEAEATLVGSDPSTDIAVVRVEVAAELLEPLQLGSSSDVTPGESVVAIGSPFGLEESVSAGIVSAVDRTIEAPDGTPITGVIQTDAALNSGNSGGPLLNAAGEVIGVNAQIASQSGAGAGVGFAIPIDTARSIVSQLIASGEAEHAFLGVSLQTVTSTAADELGLPRGVQVADVESDSPAAVAGLEAGTQTQVVDGLELTTDGDVIVAIDGQPVTSADELAAAIAGHQPGDEVTLEVVRNGDSRTVTATLASRPS
jgi:putative serine protease PepD